ncbi:hypothetical protein HYPSUDRAFT_851671 [Hypholoma sublateritium FD-334 SS-4]|uniref:Secreted protein n=1 Tax=Hypholoma sublateritium (strain FD-334 SS-4) TaxID=945553 RepID=A0A0D2M924_HYPSF|nr:hypothetical protein HYPSUDRAFT_851671 [Hypholoma sublateritium FD-334 SS-4]
MMCRRLLVGFTATLRCLYCETDSAHFPGAFVFPPGRSNWRHIKRLVERFIDGNIVDQDTILNSDVSLLGDHPAPAAPKISGVYPHGERSRPPAWHGMGRVRRSKTQKMTPARVR